LSCPRKKKKEEEDKQSTKKEKRKMLFGACHDRDVHHCCDSETFLISLQTDTASVLWEAMEYIQFLHEQVKVWPFPSILF
jgi:hypothetical protein